MSAESLPGSSDTSEAVEEPVEEPLDEPVEEEEEEVVEILDKKVKNAVKIRSLMDTEGKLEAPINLDICYMQIIELHDLEWRNIEIVPKKLKLTNTGHTALVSAKWHEESLILSGGPLASNYEFAQIHFHWGKNDMVGSEHYIDGGCMPMELHAVFFKKEYSSMDVALRREDGIVILVYLFKIVANQVLEELVTKLPTIKSADSSVRLTPVCMAYITRPFTRDYFLYWGAIPMPEITNTILWMVSRVPIGISTEQVAEFRALCDKRNQPITSNRRTLRERGHRHVYHVCPSGSTYASLLPVPWELPEICQEKEQVENF